MGVYIKGMEMPKDRPQLLWVYPNGKALTVQSDVDPWKELQAVPVPPHGRCIDADSETFPTPHRNPSNDYIKGWNACLRSVQQQPAIIPAEEGET